MDRREVLLGPQARDVDGVLAVGEDLLVLARFGLALAPRVRRALREPRRAALVVLSLVALGRRERRDELLVLGLCDFMGGLGVLLALSQCSLNKSLSRPLVAATRSLPLLRSRNAICFVRLRSNSLGRM